MKKTAKNKSKSDNHGCLEVAIKMIAAIIIFYYSIYFLSYSTPTASFALEVDDFWYSGDSEEESWSWAVTVRLPARYQPSGDNEIILKCNVRPKEKYMAFIKQWNSLPKDQTMFIRIEIEKTRFTNEYSCKNPKQMEKNEFMTEVARNKLDSQNLQAEYESTTMLDR